MLLVDDDANFRRALAIGLRLEDHEVVEVASLEDASLVLATRPFDVVLVNLLLPGGEGSSLSEHLGAALGDRVTVVVSPHPEALNAARTRIPAALQLQKPFTPSALTQLVQEHHTS